MPGRSDIQRLVYPPKAWVFVKTQDGRTLDLTNFVIGGEIKRVMDGPSSASLSLRNPNHLFTTYGEKHAILHPMDPITIYMQRFNGHHVQVFTGYLDTTPYLQLIPGVVKLNATCTLKRLMFNWFQLGQLYTLSFFEHFGWRLLPGGVIGPQNQVPGTKATAFEQLAVEKWTEEEAQGKLTSAQRKEKEANLKKEEQEAASKAQDVISEQGKESANANPFSNPGGKTEIIGDDGSFKKLLWAVLFYMGDWLDENIYIEEVPDSVPKLIAELWANFNEGERQEELETLQSFWKDIIGTGAIGSGGGPGNPQNAGEGESGSGPVPKQIMDFWENHGFPTAAAAGFAGNAYAESEYSVHASGGGLYQQTGLSNYEEVAKQGIQAQSEVVLKRLSSSLVAELKKQTDPKAAARLIDEKFEISAGSQPGEAGHDTAEWGESHLVKRETAAQKAYDERGTESAKGVKNSLPGQEETQRSKTNQGTTNKSTTLSGYHSPFEKATGITGSRTDWGQDYGVPGGQEIVAIADAVKVACVSGWEHGLGVDGAAEAGNLHAFQVTQGGPLQGHCYYYAEGVICTLKKGDKVFAGKKVCETTASGSDGGHVEFGYCNTSGIPLSKAAGETDEVPSKEGITFNRLMLQLGHAPQSNNSQPGDGPVVPGGKPEKLSPAEALTSQAESAGNIMGEATAAAFLSQIAAPTPEEWVLASTIGGQRALMNATPVIDLVEQVCKSSLRHFMSLPNGDFYAFYPDYFGEFNHREPYWQIYNIEIQAGTIELTDNNLVTHYFAIGDVTWPATNKIVQELYAGAMTVYEAFHPGLLLGHDKKKPENSEPGQGGRALVNDKEAIDFLRRYGARPAKAEYNMVYSALFDQLLAYQQFLLGWSRQFQSQFTFTFMPELFPGGKVAFPEHGLKMFIEEVTHTWDLEGGFETSALLTAPSVFATGNNTEAVSELPENMVAALLEPQRKEIGQMGSTPVAPPPPTPISPILKTREEGREAEFTPSNDPLTQDIFG